MKKTMLITFLVLAVTTMAHTGSILWKSTSMELGEVKSNSLNTIQFEFTNESETEIAILEAKGSCGCTNVSFSEEPIEPGETAIITAEFKSGKIGKFKKNIRLKTSLSEDITYLHFTGEVVE